MKSIVPYVWQSRSQIRAHWIKEVVEYTTYMYARISLKMIKTMWHRSVNLHAYHYVVIKWKHFPRYWPFVRGIHWSPVNSPHKGQWRGAFMFSLICVWINGWVNNGEAGDLRRYRAHHDVTVMSFSELAKMPWHIARLNFSLITECIFQITPNRGNVENSNRKFSCWYLPVEEGQ